MSRVSRTATIAPWHIAFLLFVAFLMASRIPHYSGKNIGRVPREYVVFVLFGVAAVVLLLATYPMEMLAVLCLVYLAAIPFAVRRQNRYVAEDEAAARAAAGEPAP